jgi:hypothetical protein
MTDTFRKEAHLLLLEQKEQTRRDFGRDFLARFRRSWAAIIAFENDSLEGRLLAPWQ